MYAESIKVPLLWAELYLCQYKSLKIIEMGGSENDRNQSEALIASCPFSALPCSLSKYNSIEMEIQTIISRMII